VSKAVTDSRRSRLFLFRDLFVKRADYDPTFVAGSRAACPAGIRDPIYKDILGDLLTPAAAFLRVAQGRSRAFLLESVEGGERLAAIPL